MDAELSSGLLIIGVTSTLLFEGGSTTELILLDLTDGSDFTLPVSDDQAAVIASHVEERKSPKISHIERTLSVVSDAKGPVEDAGLVGDIGEAAFGEVHTPGEVEVTPQF